MEPKKYSEKLYDLADYAWVLLAFCYPLIVYGLEHFVLKNNNFLPLQNIVLKEELIKGMFLSLFLVSFGLFHYIQNPLLKSLGTMAALFGTVLQYLFISKLPNLNIYFAQAIGFFLIAHGVLHLIHWNLKQKVKLK